MAKKKTDLFSDRRLKRLSKKDLAEPKPPRVKKVPKPKPDRDPKEATAWRYSQLAGLGIEVEGVEQWRAIKAISLLRARKLTIEEVATECGITSWTYVPVSKGQKGLMWIKGIPDWLAKQCRCKRDARYLISAKLEPDGIRKMVLADLKQCRTDDDVSYVGLDMAFIRGVLAPDVFDELVEAGKKRREEVGSKIPY